MAAYGYIRKSVVHDPTRMLSAEMQEGAIRALAARHGDGDVTILSDLDVSGKKDRSRRPGWDELLTAVEQGEATSVYRAGHVLVGAGQPPVWDRGIRGRVGRGSGVP